MNVETILDHKGRAVFTVSPSTAVHEASQMLTEKGIGALVVSSDGVTALGIVSERDIVCGIAERGAGVLDSRVEDIMTADIRTCSLDSTGHEVLAVMTEGRFRHLPVVEAGVLCGIVSIGDVVKARLDEIMREAEAMREYISGT